MEGCNVGGEWHTAGLLGYWKDSAENSILYVHSHFLLILMGCTFIIFRPLIVYGLETALHSL